jgi:hypothetical protein
MSELPVATVTDEHGQQYVLRGETFSEKVAIDSYTAAASGALASTDGVGDKITTAAFSIATAYGAVIALVSPKDSRSPPLVVSPFVFLAIAVVLGLIAQSVKVDLTPTNDTGVIASRIDSTLSGKRKLLALAMVALVAGLILSGVAVYKTYGPGAAKTPSTSVSIWLTPAGKQLVEDSCGNSATPFVGTVNGTDALSGTSVAVTVTKAQCPKGGGTLVLPRRAIATSKY